MDIGKATTGEDKKIERQIPSRDLLRRRRRRRERRRDNWDGRREKGGHGEEVKKKVELID
jgi:hypothetical protein